MIRPRRSSAGFTLVEIMIVVLLMSIVALAVVPNASPSVYESLNSAGNIVAADLAYARSLALLNNDRYQIQFDLAHNQYTLSYSGTNPTLAILPPSPFHSSQDPPTQNVTRLANLPRIGFPVALYDVQLLSSQPAETTTIEFSPLGATTASQPTVIWLSAATGKAERYIPVAVSPATGLAVMGNCQAAPPAAATAQATSADSASTATSATSTGSTTTNSGSGASGTSLLDRIFSGLGL